MDANHPAAPNSPGGVDLRADSAPPDEKRPRTVRDRIVGGLILAMPLLLTLWLIYWLCTTLAEWVIDPLAWLLLWILKSTVASEHLPYWFEHYVAPVIALALVLILLYSLDLLSKTRLRRGFGWVLKRAPLFSLVYNPIQQVFQSLEKGPAEPKAQRMVLVTFPHPGVKLPAFVTGVCRDVGTQKTVLCVYVPTTPVPTSGFFLLVPEEEVTELNWNTEQTLQAVMSGGLACPRDVSYFPSKPRPDGDAGPSPAPGGAADRPHGG